MSLQSEQPKTSLEKLMAKNAEDLDVMAEPQRPNMVEIQEKHWFAMLSTFKRIVEFQPEQIKALQTLATRKELSDTLEDQKQAALYEMQEAADAMIGQCKILVTENENIRLTIKDLLSQDGKNREQFFKDTQAEFTRLSSRPMTKNQKAWVWIKAAALILYPWLSALALRLLLR